jgi:hypothetical protein
VRRLPTEEQKWKKYEAKRWAYKKMVARHALEKRRRAQARKGLPLESAPSNEDDDDDDDDDEGMEVHTDFSPEARLGSAPASMGPIGGTTLPSQGLAVSLSEAWVSIEPAPVPAEAKEAEEASPLLVEVIVPTGASLGSPQRPLVGGNTEEGPVTPPHVVVPGSAVAPAIASPSAPEPWVAEEVTTTSAPEPRVAEEVTTASPSSLVGQ